ncbi:ankyrin repeat protein [Cotonvirus japonicus]|uniref:Ankyrin repeat protein n=1 Tax=Cotonvirus japonicus TaxID=2811091 RepID=A0ABM7NRN7_9VIRU|nr:ankyrin repeat protein [Cotonvirus japonicus]BCS82756.1 ankyrin repeat protein [Cotonvirus japonicus]
MSDSKVYFKIINSVRQLHNYEYIDIIKPKYIYEYINQGTDLVYAKLETNNPKFKMFKCKKTNKLSANIVRIGKIRKLSDPKTWEYMINLGDDINNIHTANLILNRVKDMNWTDVLKYLLDVMEKNKVIKFSYISKHIIDCIEHHKNDLIKFIYVSTHIIDCISRNKNDMVKIFINKIDITKCSKFYFEKWYKYAINSNNYKIAKYLSPAIINCKFSEEEIKENACILFKIACVNCDFDMIKTIFISGFRCKIYEKLLRALIDKSRLDILKYLVDNDFEIDLTYIYVLRLASREHDISMLKYLVEIGFDISKNYKNCFLVAYYHGNINIVRYIMSIGFDLLIHDVNENIMPFCKKINVITYICDTYMIHSENKLEIIKLLIEYGVDPKANNYEAFLSACKRDHKIIVEYLYNLGIDNDIINEAVIVTYNNNSFETFKFWVTIGIDCKTVLKDIYHNKNDCQGNCRIHCHTHLRQVDEYIQNIERLSKN